MRAFEKGFLEDQVEYVEPAGEAGLIVAEAEVAALLDGQQLLEALLHTARNVLVHVDQPDDAGVAERHGEHLDRPCHREASRRIFIILVNVIHGWVQIFVLPVLFLCSI